MRQTALTEIAIRSLAHPEKGSTKHLDPSLPGFGVRCTARAKAFFVMYGTDRRLKTLGHWPDMSLKTARQEAKAILAHPTLKKRSESLSDVLAAFYDDCQARGLKSTTIERYRSSLKSLPESKLTDLPPRVTEPNLLKALKVLSNWCVENELMDRNPYQNRKVVFGVRERVLSDDEITALWRYEHQPYSDIVKLLILTGQRRNQIWKYEEGWRDGDIITFPPFIMKSNRSHALPVTSYDKYLRPFSFNSWSKAKARMDQHTGVSGYVLHDFRRYFSTTMAKLGVPLHVTEQIIDHRSTITGVAAIYNRWNFIPEMREALLKYEQHIEEITK